MEKQALGSRHIKHIGHAHHLDKIQVHNLVYQNCIDEGSLDVRTNLLLSRCGSLYIVALFSCDI